MKKTDLCHPQKIRVQSILLATMTSTDDTNQTISSPLFQEVLINHLRTYPPKKCCRKHVGSMGHYVVLGVLTEVPLSEGLADCIRNNSGVPRELLRKDPNGVPLFKEEFWHTLREYLKVQDFGSGVIPFSGSITYIFAVPSNYWKNSGLEIPFPADLRHRLLELTQGMPIDENWALLDKFFGKLCEPVLLYWGFSEENVKQEERLCYLFRQLFEQDASEILQPKKENLTIWSLLDYLRMLGSCGGTYGTGVQQKEAELLDASSRWHLAYSCLQELLQDLALSVSDRHHYLQVIAREIGEVLTLEFSDLERIGWIGTARLAVPRGWPLSAIQLGVRKRESEAEHIPPCDYLPPCDYDPYLRKVDLSLSRLGILFCANRNFIEILLGLKCPVHMEGPGEYAKLASLIEFLSAAGIKFSDANLRDSIYPQIPRTQEALENVLRFRAVFPSTIDEKRFVMGYVNYWSWANLRELAGHTTCFEDYEDFTMLSHLLGLGPTV